MAQFRSNDAQMIGNFILLKAFSATLSADMHSMGDTKQVFHETLVEALADIDPNEFPDHIADHIRLDVKNYIKTFLDAVSSDVERMTHSLLITEPPRNRAA